MSLKFFTQKVDILNLIKKLVEKLKNFEDTKIIILPKIPEADSGSYVSESDQVTEVEILTEPSETFREDSPTDFQEPEKVDTVFEGQAETQPNSNESTQEPETDDPNYMPPTPKIEDPIPENPGPKTAKNFQDFRQNLQHFLLKNSENLFLKPPKICIKNQNLVLQLALRAKKLRPTRHFMANLEENSNLFLAEMNCWTQAVNYLLEMDENLDILDLKSFENLDQIEGIDGEYILPNYADILFSVADLTSETPSQAPTMQALTLRDEGRETIHSASTIAQPLVIPHKLTSRSTLSAKINTQKISWSDDTFVWLRSKIPNLLSFVSDLQFYHFGHVKNSGFYTTLAKLHLCPDTTCNASENFQITYLQTYAHTPSLSEIYAKIEVIHYLAKLELLPKTELTELQDTFKLYKNLAENYQNLLNKVVDSDKISIFAVQLNFSNIEEKFLKIVEQHHLKLTIKLETLPNQHINMIISVNWQQKYWVACNFATNKSEATKLCYLDLYGQFSQQGFLKIMETEAENLKQASSLTIKTSPGNKRGPFRSLLGSKINKESLKDSETDSQATLKPRYGQKSKNSNFNNSGPTKNLNKYMKFKVNL